MKNSLSISMILVSSFFLPLHSMKSNFFKNGKKNFNIHKKTDSKDIFSKNMLKTNNLIVLKKLNEQERLIRYYLETPWYKEGTSFASINTGSKAISEYAPSVYLECKDPIKKEKIKNLLYFNSLKAQEDLKKLKKEKFFNRAFLGGNAFTVAFCLFLGDESFMMASFFALNLFSMSHNIMGLNKKNNDAIVYQNIIDTHKAIKDSEKNLNN